MTNVKMGLMLIILCASVVTFFEFTTRKPPDSTAISSTISQNAISHKRTTTMQMEDDPKKSPVSAQQSTAKSDLISIDGNLVTIKVVDMPLTSLLGELESLTGVRFHPDSRLYSETVSGQAVMLTLPEALSNLLINFKHALFYEGQRLQSVGVFPKNGAAVNMQALVNGPTEEHLQTRSPVISQQQLIMTAHESELDTEFLRGLESNDPDIRAMTLITASERNFSANPEYLTELVFNDPSELVRGVALSTLLADKAISMELKRNIASELEIDGNSEIRSLATDYLSLSDYTPTYDPQAENSL